MFICEGHGEINSKRDESRIFKTTLEDGTDASLERYVETAMLVFKHTQRIYCFRDRDLIAVFARNHGSKQIFNLAHCQNWAGRWRIPFLYPSLTRFVIARIGQDVRDFGEAKHWADEVLSNDVATAIVIEKDQIFAAWETVDGRFALIAKGPRYIPTFG